MAETMKHQPLHGVAIAALFTILAAAMSTPSYTGIRGEAISLRNWLRIVLWTEFGGFLFCSSMIVYCFWNPAAEMVFFRMHFMGAMLKLLIAILAIRYLLDCWQHLRMLQSQSINSR